MTTQQLYIDGELADVGESTEVNLSIVSNLLSGGADFAGNKSLTVTLPSTLHNQRLIEHADKVHGGGDVPYTYHTIDYYRNGVQIIKDGQGCVMGTTPEEIELAITWGVRVAVESLLTTDETLNSITTNATITFNEQPSVTSYYDALVDEVFYASMDCYKHASINEYFNIHVVSAGRSWDANNLQSASSYLHPSVRMSWILTQLQVKYGVVIDYDDAMDDIGTLIVPLINKIPNDVTYNGGYRAKAVENPSWGVSYNDNYLVFTTTQSSTIIGDVSGSTLLTCTTAFSGMMRFSLVFYIPRTDLVQVAYPIYRAKYPYNIIIHCGSNTYECRLLPKDAYFNEWDINTNNQVPIYVTGSLPIEMAVGNVLNLGITCIGNASGVNPGIRFTGGNINIYEITAKDNEVQPGQIYPVAGNLPEIKPIDLIKFLCAITGTFPVQSSTPTRITMKPIEALFDWDNAVDWTSRILSETDRSVASNNEYSLDSWAQQNWWKWKEDETVHGNYDGCIDVENDTLELTRTVLEFPFAGTDGNNVPMYTSSSTYDADSDTWTTEVEWDECEPRVLRLTKGDNDEAVAVFDLSMANSISSYYSSLPATLRHPHIITETIRIRDIEIPQVDESMPIYLGQHGAYFALLELTTNGDNTAEVKLLKLTKTED